MSTPFAVSSDVADRWRPLTSAEANVATVLIDDASAMVRERWTDVDARITNGSLTTESVLRVVAGMVKRAMLNASYEGVEQMSQNAGPFAESRKFANPNGNLYFSAADVLVFEPEGYTPRAKVGWLA